MASLSMKDVAKAAGVSLGTVSNVINHPDLVRPDTRARVERVIQQLGFVRHESARRLRAGTSRVIAYLMLDASNPFFADVARAIDQVARAHGLGLFLCDSANDANREDEYLALLLEERVRGVLVTAVEERNPRLRQLADRGVPIVFVDRSPDTESEWCSVGVDDTEGGRLAAEHLIEQGHRRIGFVGGPLAIPQVRDRLAGAREIVDRQSKQHSLVVLQTANLDVAGGRSAAARLVGMPRTRRPTALFCANDLLALGALQELSLQGLVVPDDVAIVGYDDIDFAAAAAVPLSSVRQPRADLGRAAAELLITEAAASEGHVHEHVQFVPELVVRASSRRPAARSA